MQVPAISGPAISPGPGITPGPGAGPSLVVSSPAGPGVLGLGIDLVDVPRFATLLARRPKMAERLFTAEERAYAYGLTDPAPSLAARFAAKEAVMKALGVGLGAFGFRDVEVHRQPSGFPQLVLSGRAARLASDRHVISWMVSLTHTSSTAAAVALALA